WTAGGQRANRGALGYIAQGDPGRTIAGSKKKANTSAQGGGLESTEAAAGAIDVRAPVGSLQSAAGLLGDKERPGEPNTLSDRSLADSHAQWWGALRAAGSFSRRASASSPHLLPTAAGILSLGVDLFGLGSFG